MTKIINYLNNELFINEKKIEDWLIDEYSKHNACLYSSVDIRHSGDKIVPVDTNLFPAGFNNFNKHSIENAISYVRIFLSKHYPGVSNITIIPENHTRNGYYLDNLLTLKNIITQAGYNNNFALFDIDEPMNVISQSGQALEINNIKNFEAINGLKPDLIILNNDLSNGIPDILANCKIPIIPSLKLGWHNRSKANHFKIYQQITEKFCKEFNLDPFFITASYHECGKINFKEKKNIECVANNVDKLIHFLKQKYQEYDIKQDPYVFIKADKGTYGMGIMTAKSGEEIIIMNKKIRNKMSVLKSGLTNSDVIIQEGIMTIDAIDNNVAEPLIYLIDPKPIGMTYRLHNSKDQYDNLNSVGMSFKTTKLTFKDDNYKGFSLIAQLATLASCMEFDSIIT